jgi:hypothetical protein
MHNVRKEKLRFAKNRLLAPKNKGNAQTEFNLMAKLEKWAKYASKPGSNLVEKRDDLQRFIKIQESIKPEVVAIRKRELYESYLKQEDNEFRSYMRTFVRMKEKYERKVRSSNLKKFKKNM